MSTIEGEGTAGKKPEWVSATDVGTYSYCGRLYWLTKVQGKKVDPDVESRLHDGHEKHEEHGHQVEKAQGAKRHVIDAMLWSAIGVLIMWLGVQFGLSAKSRWVDVLLFLSAIGLAASISYMMRSRYLSKIARIPEKATVIASDTSHVARAKTLRDHGTGLYGRPDYVLEESVQGQIKLVPVELKPTKKSSKLYESDEMQLVHYLTLFERLNPLKSAGFGRVVYGQTAFVVQLTEGKKKKLFDLVEKVKLARRAENIDRTHKIPGRCGGCAVRHQCGQALTVRGRDRQGPIPESVAGLANSVEKTPILKSNTAEIMSPLDNSRLGD